MQLENVQNCPKNDQNRPQNVENLTNWPTNIPKVCKVTVKFLLRTKTTGLPLKILLLVPKPTGHLPSCRNNLHLVTSSMWCRRPCSRMISNIFVMVFNANRYISIYSFILSLYNFWVPIFLNINISGAYLLFRVWKQLTLYLIWISISFLCLHKEIKPK